jgi:DNA polymerase-1
MVLQIHDELLFEVPDEEIDKAGELIKDAMEQVLSLSVPLTVEIGIGKNWREC